ncbi:MAG: flavodoxin-dependent (E)-4-hydroxy-3-methylbut-2-enyl-diphosphate synthase [Candidatus Omnitrophica bacterium]|nr:flavodoxin-dependent (E)-4-hydroxy-3-methylbut-2-enyl-diphosphate synthase [Candidatus Omnitrophota bacterium]
MTTERKKTRQVRIGPLTLGGDAPVRLQSMTTTTTADVEATVKQILQLEEAGCEIVRVAVPHEEDARALNAIIKRIHIPLVADIHYHYRLALIALDQGISKLRLNPGNIGTEDRIRMVVEKTKACGVPIRIGVNGGSLEKDILAKHGHPTPEALVESAERHIKILERLNFHDIVISLKASDPGTTIKAYQLMSARSNYPLHLGVTESGTLLRGTVASTLALGTLLREGIGDTIRISLTAESVEEVKVGRFLLEFLGLRKMQARVISCPSCGRAEVDVFKMADEVEQRALSMKEPLTISILGCAVNGPGEAGEADFGVTGGKEKGMIYENGKQIKTVSEKEIVDALFEEINRRKSAVADKQGKNV